MVAGDLGDPALGEMKNGAVADIEDGGRSLAAVRRPYPRYGRAAGPFVVGTHYRGEAGMYRRLHRTDRLRLRCGGATGQSRRKKLHGAFAGPGAVALATHAIGDQGQAVARGDEIAVLVAGAGMALMGHCGEAADHRGILSQHGAPQPDCGGSESSAPAPDAAQSGSRWKDRWR